MSERIELRKCAICHKSFGWNGITRCICSECKVQNVSGDSHKSYDKPLFIMVNHDRCEWVSA